MEKVPNGNFSVDGELRFSSGNSGDYSSPHPADGTATTPSNSQGNVLIWNLTKFLPTPSNTVIPVLSSRVTTTTGANQSNKYPG
jgi:hypothetical protein